MTAMCWWPARLPKSARAK